LVVFRWRGAGSTFRVAQASPLLDGCSRLTTPY
jgi:hypothetical protein